MTYRLFKTPNGIKQVPVREEDEFSDFDYNTQIPEEAKGVVKGNEAPFVEQTRNQKRNLTESMTGQVAFQQDSLQYNNLQIVNINYSSFATGSASQIDETYNSGTAPGNALNDTVMFSGIASGDNNDALYYNISYVSCRVKYGQITDDSYIEWYPLQKLAGGSSAGGKIPVQISNTAYNNDATATTSGSDYGVQSIGCGIMDIQQLYNSSDSLKEVRCIGLALKSIFVNFDSAITTDNVEINVELGIDLKSGGNSY